MKKYNKLVRDNIPEIITADGKSCEFNIASKEEHYDLLKEKLKEETEEFLQDENLEELADVLEVLFSLANSLGYEENDLLEKRIEKKKERGGFNKGIVLKQVNEK